MSNRNKRILIFFVLFSLILVLGIGYALLQANLQINGASRINNPTWNIYFDNIQVTTGSVMIGEGDSAATIDPNNNCKVDFEITLEIPGDFYEFTVDVKNDGTIDAMVEALTKTLKINNVEVNELPYYLTYTVTYEDDSEILDNHLLAAGYTETYKVRVEYLKDIDSLPTETTLMMSIEPKYMQASTAAVDPHPLPDGLVIVNNHPSNLTTNLTGGMYRYQGTNVTNNFICFGTTYTSTCTSNPDTYLYRILGITEDGAIKVIKNRPISSQLKWWSNATTNVKWPDSLAYSGLNGSSFLNNTTYVPNNTWKEKIATVNWTYGDTGLLGFFSYNGSSAYQTESNWADSVSAKVGLMYMHDFYLAYPGGNPADGSTSTNAWVHMSKTGTAASEMILDRVGYHGGDRVYIFWMIARTNGMGSSDLNYAFNVRPVFYLENTVKISNLDSNNAGTSSNPYMLEL